MKFEGRSLTIMIPKEEGPNASSNDPDGTEAVRYIRQYRKGNRRIFGS